MWLSGKGGAPSRQQGYTRGGIKQSTDRDREERTGRAVDSRFTSYLSTNYYFFTAAERKETETKKERERERNSKAKVQLRRGRKGGSSEKKVRDSSLKEKSPGD